MLDQDREAPASARPNPGMRREAPPTAPDDLAPEGDPLPELVRDQLARELADIESAAAALRQAEPALESWSEEGLAATPKPRPVWMLVGLLWLSTALVAASAIIMIAVLVG